MIYTFLDKLILPTKYCFVNILNLLTSLKFNEYYNFLFAIIIAILCIFIFVKGSFIYSRSSDKRMLVFALGFLLAAIFELLPFVQFFNANLEFYYLFFRNLSIVLPFLICIFYMTDPIAKSKSMFFLKAGLVYLISFFVVIFLPFVIKSEILLYVVLYPSLVVIYSTFFILFALVYSNIRQENNLKPFSKFSLGLIFLFLSQLYIPELTYLTSVYRFFIHLFVIVGFTLIFLGLENIQFKSKMFSIKQKMLIYPYIFLIFSYIVWIFLDYSLFDINIPIYVDYFFIFFFLISLFLQYLLVLRITVPIDSLISHLENLRPGVEPEKIDLISDDEISILSKKLNELTSLEWEYASSLKLKQSQLQSSNDREKLLRDIIQITRSTLDKDKIFDIICEELTLLFDIDRVVLAEYPYSQNPNEWIYKREYVKAEYRDKIKYFHSSSLKESFFSFWTQKFIVEKSMVEISDIADSDMSDGFKQLYAEINAKSLIGLPIKQGENVWGGLILVKLNEYKNWTSIDKEFLESIASQLYVAIRQAELYLTKEEQIRQEKVVTNINNKILLSETLEEASLNMTKEICEVFDIDGAALRLFDYKSKTFLNIFSAYTTEDLNLEKKQEMLSLIDNLLYESVITSRQNLIIDDMENLSGFPKQIAKELKLKSVLLAPVFYNEIPLAIVILMNTHVAKKWKKEELSFLSSIVQQVSLGIHLFELNYNLVNALDNEALLRQIIVNIRKLKNEKDVFLYIAENIFKVFSTSRILRLKNDENFNMRVENEFNIDNKLQYGDIVFAKNEIDEFFAGSYESLIEVSDVEEIKNLNLRERLLSKNIYSFLIYPIIITNIQEKLFEVTMICSSSKRKWTFGEKNFFRLIIDTTTGIYLEIKQVKEIENIRNTFIATLTHDLRGPIYAEQKALEFIMSRKPDIFLSSVKEFIEDLYKTNEDLLRIVDNILNVYHYESGNPSLNLNHCKIEEIIENAVRSMKYLANDKQIEIFVELEDSLPEVFVDKNEISRVIINLLNNAIKHNLNGTKISISAKKTDDKILVSVSDNGSGISKSDQVNIFIRYPTEKRRIGTGLGLYLSKQIVELHKGKIWFLSEEGKGTTFYFELPL